MNIHDDRPINVFRMRTQFFVIDGENQYSHDLIPLHPNMDLLPRIIGWCSWRTDCSIGEVRVDWSLKRAALQQRTGNKLLRAGLVVKECWIFSARRSCHNRLSSRDPDAGTEWRRPARPISGLFPPARRFSSHCRWQAAIGRSPQPVARQQPPGLESDYAQGDHCLR